MDSEQAVRARPDLGALNALPLHHVGIVQPSREAVDGLMKLLGLEEDYSGLVPIWSVTCIFTKPLGRSPIEFIVPDGGPLAGFNKGLGGLHHIALETQDLAEVARVLEAQDMELLEPQPIKGAGNFLCNFLSPIYTQGLTIEFVQPISQS